MARRYPLDRRDFFEVYAQPRLLPRDRVEDDLAVLMMVHLAPRPGRMLSDEKEDSLTERVLALLAQGRPLTRTTLRESLAAKNERLGEVLTSLERAGSAARLLVGSVSAKKQRIWLSIIVITRTPFHSPS